MTKNHPRNQKWNQSWMILGENFFFKFLQNFTKTLFLAYKILNPES